MRRLLPSMILNKGHVILLLEAAVNKHVLSVREAGHWARAFVRYTREMRKSLESDEDSAGDA